MIFLCYTQYTGKQNISIVFLLHVVVGDGGGCLSSIWNVFTDISFVVYDFFFGYWLLGPMSQIANNLDADVTEIQAGCTNTTDDTERWENEDFFKVQ